MLQYDDDSDRIIVEIILVADESLGRQRSIFSSPCSPFRQGSLFYSRSDFPVILKLTLPGFQK